MYLRVQPSALIIWNPRMQIHTLAAMSSVCDVRYLVAFARRTHMGRVRCDGWLCGSVGWFVVVGRERNDSDSMHCSPGTVLLYFSPGYASMHFMHDVATVAAPCPSFNHHAFPSSTHPNPTHHRSHPPSSGLLFGVCLHPIRGFSPRPEDFLSRFHLPTHPCTTYPLARLHFAHVRFTCM